MNEGERSDSLASQPLEPEAMMAKAWARGRETKPESLLFGQLLHDRPTRPAKFGAPPEAREANRHPERFALEMRLKRWYIPEWEASGISPTAQHELDEILADSHPELPTVTEQALPELVTTLSQPASADQPLDRSGFITALTAWVSEDPNQRVTLVEQTLAQQLSANHESLTLSLLVLLGNLNQHRRQLFVDDQLAKELELHGHVSAELASQLSVLNGHPEASARRQLHHVLDFMTEYMRTVQDHVEHELETVAEYYGGFFEEFHNQATYHAGLTSNYLLDKHWQELVDLRQLNDSPKPGVLAGVGGGATDEMIYTFSHLAESYQYRLALGIAEGSPIMDLIIPIAPHLLGRYHHSRVESVYPLPSDLNIDSAARRREEALIAANHPADNRIYDELNKPLPANLRHPSNKLRKLQNLWDFGRRLAAHQRQFYYDLEQVSTADLHPLVVGELIGRNVAQLRRQPDHSEPEPLALDTLAKQLDPVEPPDQGHLYDYRFVTALGIRKKIEDDFGIDFGQITPWIQYHFLNYLERQNVPEVSRLQSFVRHYGVQGLAAFVALEANPQAGAAILGLEETHGPELTRQIVAGFHTLVEQTGHLEQFVSEHFALRTAADQETVRQIGRQLLQRAEQVLLHARSNQELIDNVKAIADEQLALATSFRVLKSNYPDLQLSNISKISFTSLAGPKISDLDRQAMREILTKNWEELPDVAPTVVANFDRAGQNPHSQFYLLKYQNRLLGFMRFDQLENGDLEWGSFNIRPVLRRSGLGEAFMTILNEKARHQKIHANAHPRQEIATRYIGADFGFVVDAMIKVPAENAHEPPTLAFSLIRDDAVNPNYELFNLPAEELAKEWHTNRFGPSDDRIILRFNQQTEYQIMTETMTQLLKDGRYVLTAYRPFPPKNGLLYLAFETRLLPAKPKQTNPDASQQ